MPMPGPDAPIEEWIKYFEAAIASEEAITISPEIWRKMWPHFREDYARKLYEQMLREKAKAAAARLRLGGAVVITILIVIACFFVVRWELSTPVTNLPQGGVVCNGSAEHSMNFTDNIWAFGCRRSMNQAFAAAEAACKNLQSTCTGTCSGGGTCTSVPSVVSTQHTPALVSCGTEITFQCPCKCI